jgi:hypothetical protein
MKNGFLFFILFISGLLSAQSHFFQTTIGGPSVDIGRSAVETYDKELAAFGSTSSYGAGSSDMWLVKIWPDGWPKWAHTYGGTGVEQGYSMKETKVDSGFILAGYTDSYGAGGYDFYLVKTDSVGNPKWAKTYGGADWDMAYSVSLTSDGGYILVGGTYSFGAGDEDVYLVKTNSNGDTLWTKHYGGKKQDEGRSVKQTFDGGYIIAGSTKSYGDTINGNAYIIRTDYKGDTLWTRNFGGIYQDDARDIIQTLDSGFYFVGGTYSRCYGVAGTNQDSFHGMLKANGDSIALQHWGAAADDRMESIIQLSPTLYCMLGSTKSYGFANNTFDMWIIFTDQFCNWLPRGTTYGDPSKAADEEGFSICTTTDNGYLLCGYSNGFNTNGIPDFFIVKADSGTTHVPIIAGIAVPGLTGISYGDIFPNPADDVAYLHTTPALASGKLTFEFFDLEGRNVTANVHLETGTGIRKLSFNRAELPPGMYFYRLTTEEKSSSGKIILR